MSDPVRALGGATYQGLVRIEELPPQGMIQIRGDLGRADLQRAVTDAAGVAMPEPRGANCVGGRGVLWMSPDEVQVLVPQADRARAIAALTSALVGQHALVADVSDMRACFKLEGFALRDVLAKLTPMDLSADSFAPGELRRTRFAQVAAGVWLPDDHSAQVFCFRSVAGYMFDLLCQAADPAAEVGYYAS